MSYFVCPPEAMYRIYKFKLHDQSRIVYTLAVYLKDEQYVYFRHGSEKEMIDKNLDTTGTTLTAWFDLNNILLMFLIKIRGYGIREKNCGYQF